MSAVTQPGLRAIAYHEAGHAVIAAVLNVPFASVSIVPTKKSLGRVMRHHLQSTPEEREKDVLARLAGAIAEAKHTGWNNWEGAIEDYRGLGLTEEEEKRLQNKASALLQEHWPLVCKVTSALLVKRRLTQHQVTELVKQSPVWVSRKVL